MALTKLPLKALALLLLIVFTAPLSHSSVKKPNNNWASMDRRINVWDAVAGKGNYTVSENGLEATFRDKGVEWTIIGANAGKVAPTPLPVNWPVKGKSLEVLTIPEPMTSYQILPFTEHIKNAIPSDRISLTSAPGVYIPASLVIRSGDKELDNVMIGVTDLVWKSTNNTTSKAEITRKNIDIRVVKCWYQAGKAIGDIKHKVLTPELLLHDDDLVRVDYVRQVNLLRDYDDIRDSESLQPFTIPKRQNKQIWISIKVPATCNPGLYSGNIHITVRNKPAFSIPLSLKVLSYKLLAPPFVSSIYYTGKLDPSWKGSISSEKKSRQQLKAELVDLYAHGVTNPTVYQRFDRTLLGKVLEVREAVGMGHQPLYYLGLTTGNTSDEKRLEILKRNIKDILIFTKSYGIDDVYFYGLDEAKEERLTSQRKSWQAVKNSGGKVFVAGKGESNFDLMGDIQDLIVSWGALSKNLAEKWHSSGHKIWSYANPQGGVEDPELYRRNYGLMLWEYNYDGACTYAYQRGFGNIWNDFDSTRYRDHVFAYPTKHGVIDTIQWEGYREGIYDARYLATILASMDLKKDDGHSRQKLVNEVHEYLNNKNSNLSLLRTRIQSYQ